MPELEIPPRFHHGLSRIRELTDESIVDLVKGLRSVKSPTTAVDDVAAIAKNIDRIGEVVVAIFSVSQVRAYRDQTLKAFAQDLCDAMTKISEPLALRPTERTEFSQRIEQLLDTEPLMTFAKANSLKWEQDLLLHDSKIVTDMRPVFGADVTKEPAGFVVIHTLKLEFHDFDGHKEMYFGVDDLDLSKQKKVI